MANTFQAAASGFQAVANVIDASINAVDLTSKTINAESILENSHSHMEAKIVELNTLKGTIESKFKKYWFPRRKRYDSWLIEVEKNDGQVKKLKLEFADFKNVSVMHHPFRLALDEKIKTRCIEIDKLLKQGTELEDDLVKTQTPRVIKFPKLFSITNISSLKEKLDWLLHSLKNNRYNTIKVEGLPMTGKRVLIQHLNNHEYPHGMFDIVIWLQATDYENCNNGKSLEATIQDIIVTRLGLCIGGIKNENVIAEKIRDELIDSRYLLLLDDVKDDIDLATIGIPQNTGGSKIVYTTTLPKSLFAPSTTLKTERLDESDSYQMFEDILLMDNDLEGESQIGFIVYDLVKWCDGFYSLIEKVAKNFKTKKSVESWNDGWEMLNTSPCMGDEYMKSLENFLRFSYGGLKENQKICFLFCALYPKDNKIPIDCLFDCWETNNLLQHGVPKSSTRQSILDHLEEMALLVKCSKQFVTIDRIIRGEALKILQEHDQFKCVVAEEVKILENNDGKDIHWISLANSEIDALPTEVNFPNLTTLFLQKNAKLKTISNLFFKNMNSLLVLDLHKTEFELQLPMSHLKMLKVLYVNGCPTLKGAPFKLEGLDNMLEVLDISGCIINEIPQDIKKLKHLRRLIVSIDCGTLSDLKICDLCSLKELIIDVKLDVEHKDAISFVTWCNKVIGDILEQIDALEDLTALKFRFKDEIVDVIQASYKTLRIFVPKQRTLKRVWNTRRNPNHYNAQVYIGFRMTTNLEIPRCFYSYNSFVISCDQIISDSVIEEKVLANVKGLIMMNDNLVEHLDHTGISSTSIHHIQGVLVKRCNKIENLIQNDGFLRLETLFLSECSKLKVLFSDNVKQQLVSLKHLEIRDCSGLEKINMLSSGGDILPSLKTLVLHNLGRLMMICSDMKWSKMSNLEILKCPMLTELPLTENSAMNLRTIKVDETWWGNLQIDSFKQKFNLRCGHYEFGE